MLFLRFFMDLNDRIFTVLVNVENTETNYGFENEKDIRMSPKHSVNDQNECKNDQAPNILTNDHIKQMGLDHVDDKDFLNELIRFYDFNLVINS